jgi:thioredoxin-dependent peroxiredoxin
MATLAQMLETGQQAPDFDLATGDGERVKLSELRGKPVVLYFYPKDDTPGCTAEACQFRDAYGEFRAHGAEILGVSPDDEASHAKFAEKFSLPFPLLADPDHAVAEAYDVWREKKNYGKTYMGILRSTFVIGADGTIEQAMYGVKADGHPEKVLQALQVSA